MTDNGLTELTEAERRQAMDRFEVLRPHLEDDVPLPRAATAAGTPLRTTQRWLHRHRSAGLAGLARTHRSSTGRRTDPAMLTLAHDGPSSLPRHLRAGVPAPR
ncbi:helix-turn-helix domain-containing protein [Nocardia beijingensis]|uniref:helix-turn-helix domain-containing protein n=1 Tax=Nocardia beijingensis TaxID=95162 RepID=UPI001895B121|nr:helix-turn-helix domain-containing protein [Nocardia beijingensis]MBF6468112.1 helix-turn-helix domain-containing protein [Nocardia beijingensis]